MMDYYSDFWEIDAVTDTSSEIIATYTKAHFAQYGIPEKAIADNIPQFQSQTNRGGSRLLERGQNDSYREGIPTPVYEKHANLGGGGSGGMPPYPFRKFLKTGTCIRDNCSIRVSQT